LPTGLRDDNFAPTDPVSARSGGTNVIESYVVFVPYSEAPLPSESTVDHVDDPFVVPNPVPTDGALFPIDDWSMDVEQTLNIGSQSSGAGAGRVTFNPFTITRRVDQASPRLFAQTASGTPFEFLDLLQVKAGGDGGTLFLAWRFGLVAVKTIGWTSDEDGPKETVSFEYGSLTIGYQPSSPGGALIPMEFKGWDRVRNVAI
jgi:type VI protein secretion system component Hcp